MRFNPRARIDQGTFTDAGRSSGGLGRGGMRIPLPTGGGGKMGLGGVLVVVLLVVLTQCMGRDLLSSNAPDSSAVEDTECRTGADANASDKCAVALFATSVQDYWDRAYPAQSGNPYAGAQTVSFSGGVDSGCGSASAGMGPFYCPTDRRVYLDATFFDDMLEGELGAEGGPFAIGYVVAHEYGHHIENLLGVFGRMKTQQGPRSDSVKAELMADCFAGMWARDAQQTVDEGGVPIIEDLTQDDIARAIDAAQAVGDDRIQSRSGRVNPDQWTHGSAAQRVDWFNVGLKEGSLQACNTFAPGAL